MNKRGQVTLFIIIAIVIVAVVVLFIMFRGKIFAPKAPKIPSEFEGIYSYTQDCVKQTSEEALIFVGMQGGLAEPTLALETEIGNISYWVYNGYDKKPSLNEIDTSISSYIEYVLPLCTNGFYSFTQQGYEINESEFFVNTTIKEDEVNIAVEYPIIIRKSNMTITFKDFSASVPVRLPKIYDEASKIADMHKNVIDMDALAESELDIAVMQYSDTDYIYTITDNQSIVLNEPYTFMFAAR